MMNIWSQNLQTLNLIKYGSCLSTIKLGHLFPLPGLHSYYWHLNRSTIATQITIIQLNQKECHGQSCKRRRRKFSTQITWSVDNEIRKPPGDDNNWRFMVKFGRTRQTKSTLQKIVCSFFWLKNMIRASESSYPKELVSCLLPWDKLGLEFK